MRILVTGCYGFIGSHFIKYALNKGHTVVGFGRNSIQKNKKRLNIEHDNLSVINGDLKDDLSDIMERVDAIVHLAAKTFVDHSIRDPKPFVYDNILGMYNLLETAKQSKVSKILIQSTDEVYGQILEGQFDETSPLNPRNPYASTKAAADMLALGYENTYGMEICIARLENVYGPYQHPQKAIPTFVRRALNGEPLPVYGDGQHRRQWIHVDDNCHALLFLLENWNPGEVFHVAGHQELSNIELAQKILEVCGKPHDQFEFIPDFDIRPGHDRRYALSSDKIRALGWKPQYDIDSGFRNVVQWYIDNPWWVM